MKRYQEITKQNYCIQEVYCICEPCNYKFKDYIPLNYELTCFEDCAGEKYFLPTYGDYGYLNLLEKLVDGWRPSDCITERVSGEFEEKFDKITPYKLSLFEKLKCPVCGSNDIVVRQRTTIENYPVKWIKIDINKV